MCPLQSLFFLEGYIIRVSPPHPPFKNSVLLWNPGWPWTSITPTSVFWVLDTMMDFQMTANICKILAPGTLLQNWSVFTPDSWTQMTFSSFPDRWELLRSWRWERMRQWLVVLGELPSTMKEGVTDVSVGRELPVVIVGFSFWPGMDCSRQQTKQLFFPSCVSLAQSSCLHACWASWWCEVKMADKLPQRAAQHSIYCELRSNGTTQWEIEQSCLIPIKMSFYPRHQELPLLQMPFLLYSCRLLTFESKDIDWVCDGSGVGIEEESGVCALWKASVSSEWQTSWAWFRTLFFCDYLEPDHTRKVLRHQK